MRRHSERSSRLSYIASARSLALGFAETPADYLVGVHAAVQAINTHLAAAEDAAVGADALMPMLCVAVAHADAPCGYALLQHAKATLATAAEAASELSYCLCSYECAVEFVLQVDEAQLERMSVAGSLSASMSLPATLSNVTQTF